MRYSDHDQRGLDIASGKRLDAFNRFIASQPCKDEQHVVNHDGSCLRCCAAQGERCLEKQHAERSKLTAALAQG